MKRSEKQRRVNMVRAVMLACAAGSVLGALPASGQNWDENPPVMLQWFETRWTDMERRMPDYFLAGYGSVWLPPVGRGYLNPRDGNQNSSSAGYDPFDRFDLGAPGRETAYGTEAFFDAIVDEFHRANGEVYVDMVLNHNAGRQTGAEFQEDGGYPGFWMASASTPVNKQPTDNWGDFHAGISGGYYQSENPSNPRYCLHQGDLVALIDIDHATNHQFIRQPTTAGNPQNIPGGTFFNRPNANNARFYFDTALGTTSVNNPGINTGAGPLTTGIFSPPCTVPARNEPASLFTTGRFNLSNPMAGDPVPENATAYLLRWTQWMLDVHKVDGFRIDAIKHMPSWFYDSFYDSVVANRRQTPDGRWVTPFSFGESVEGNTFTFDRYIRKPNGRASGRTGDSFGNRDALDLVGAGALRNIIFNNPGASWSGAQGEHIDNTDDGFNNGSIGVNHIWSHDNGSQGNGNSMPAVPAPSQQGWFAHAYLVMRPGQAKIYHNGRGVPRGGGFFPREGVPVALGWDPAIANLNPVITNLVQISNWTGRGFYFPRWQDSEVNIFERASPLTGGGFSGNVLVGANRSYQGTGITSFDQRTFSTNFPQGTRLLELTGNAALANVDPSNQIDEVITVGAGGSVTMRVPRNQNINGITHNRGFVVYAPALPAGTLSILGASGQINPDSSAIPDVRQRLATIPIVTGSTFDIQLITTNGDPGAGNNNNADDNALFRIDQGFRDFNGTGGHDIGFDNTVVPGYEQFVTQRQPLAGTGNTQGIYRQTINTSLLDEGTHYISVAAFRKRNPGEAPLFREFRSVIFVDRLPADFDLATPGPFTTPSATFGVTTADRGLSRVWIMYDLPPSADPLAPANLSSANEAQRYDRFEWRRNIGGMQHGFRRITLVGQEQSLRNVVKDYQVFVDLCTADINNDGEIDLADFFEFLNAFDTSDPLADVDGVPGVDLGDFFFFLNAFDVNC